VKNKRGLTPLASLLGGGTGGRGRNPAADVDPDAVPNPSSASTIELLRKLGAERQP
jgi:hypothetical protein